MPKAWQLNLVPTNVVGFTDLFTLAVKARVNNMLLYHPNLETYLQRKSRRLAENPNLPKSPLPPGFPEQVDGPAVWEGNDWVGEDQWSTALVRRSWKKLVMHCDTSQAGAIWQLSVGDTDAHHPRHRSYLGICCKGQFPPSHPQPKAQRICTRVIFWSRVLRLANNPYRSLFQGRTGYHLRG